jgi:2-keto-3-deoxy-L-rhamnonate aldolase RhmA
MKNKLRIALLQRKPVFGAWMQIGHPAIAEILGTLGFDWICVDLEHGAIDLEGMTHLFRTIDAHESVPVTRVPANDPVWIRRSLDAGARGLIIPMINSVQDAESAVRAAKYPPRGERGFGYSRANMHGMKFEETIVEANNEIAIIAQIEHRKGIENIDAILQVPDIDGVFIGPLDLSGSYGKAGQMACPEVKHALARYLEACQHWNMSAGIHIVRPDAKSVSKAIEQGYTLIGLGLDNVFLETGASQALKCIAHAGKNRKQLR